MKPFISVVTVEKDDPVALGRTARSVLGQECSDFEWVIISSSVDEESRKMLKALAKNSRVTVVYQDPKGIYPAMNLGARTSQGKYLWFLNSGDFFLGPSSVHRVVSDLKLSKSDLLLTCVVNVTHSGHVYGFTSPKIERVERKLYAHANHQGTIVSTSTFFQIGGFDEKYRLAADTEFLDKVLLRGKFRINDLCLVGFTLGGASSNNITETLHEISQYRPEYRSQKYLKIVAFKTFLRSRLIGKNNASRFIGFYLNKREVAELQAHQETSEFLFEHHWVHRVSGQVALLSCCI